MVVRSTKIAAIFGVFPKALHWGYSVQNDMLEQLLAYTRWQHRPVTCGMILISVGFQHCDLCLSPDHWHSVCPYHSGEHTLWPGWYGGGTRVTRCTCQL